MMYHMHTVSSILIFKIFIKIRVRRESHVIIPYTYSSK